MASASTAVPSRGASHTARRAALVAAAACVALVAPFLLYPIFLINVLCFALFACAFNLMMGFAGLLSFGHAAFFGGSAYVTAYAAKAWGWPAELSILAGLVTGGGLGVVFGWISIRRQGIYFGMVTMALAQLVYFAALQAKFTGGEDGIQGVPQRSALPMLDLTDNRVMYFYALAVFLAGFAVIYRTVHSPFGHVLRAIRENEGRAISLGYDVPRFKLLAFALSGALSGLAGGLKAIALQIATLTDVEFTMSGEVVLMTLVGGVATLTGPVVGAAVVVAMLTYLAAFGVWVKALQGIIFIACVLAFRRGIVGEIAAMLERSRQT